MKQSNAISISERMDAFLLSLGFVLSTSRCPSDVNESPLAANVYISIYLSLRKCFRVDRLESLSRLSSVSSLRSLKNYTSIKLYILFKGFS
jgi:hypothetical protein